PSSARPPRASTAPPAGDGPPARIRRSHKDGPAGPAAVRRGRPSSGAPSRPTPRNAVGFHAGPPLRYHRHPTRTRRTESPHSVPDSAEPGYRGWLPTVVVRPTGAEPVDIRAYPGRLIAIESTDGAGRSTQIALLREWLETQGFGVMHTGLTRGRLAGEGLKKAKQGTTLGQLTLDLFYATDFADRLENEILPALRAGFVVLTDRYLWSVLARAIVRSMDEQWVRDVYRFAPRPHAVFYLKVATHNLVPRVLARGSFDYW